MHSRMLAVCGYFEICTCFILHILLEAQHVCVSLADILVTLIETLI